MSPQEYSDRFDADFLATAKTIKPGGGLNIETVRFALGSQPKHKVLPFDERCERIFSVFSFLHKNVAELERLHLLYLENGHMSRPIRRARAASQFILADQYEQG